MKAVWASTSHETDDRLAKDRPRSGDRSSGGTKEGPKSFSTEVTSPNKEHAAKVPIRTLSALLPLLQTRIFSGWALGVRASLTSWCSHFSATKF
jgi:hypothetical protein